LEALIMSAAELVQIERPIQRWDREPSEFYGALARIWAELGYDPHSSGAARLPPEPSGPVRQAATGSGLSPETKQRLSLAVTHLPTLLPALEYGLRLSHADSMQRLDHYQRLFSEACEQIDLREFPLDESSDPETYSQRVDALSRAMLLKSELLLVIEQFNLLRQEYRARVRSSSSARLKIVA
jgi:hypothetical protein